MASANKFDFRRWLQYLPRDLVEQLHEFHVRSGGAPAPERDLIVLNSYAESVEAESAASSDSSVVMAKLKRLEREIDDLKAQLWQ